MFKAPGWYFIAMVGPVIGARHMECWLITIVSGGYPAVWFTTDTDTHRLAVREMIGGNAFRTATPPQTLLTLLIGTDATNFVLRMWG